MYLQKTHSIVGASPSSLRSSCLCEFSSSLRSEKKLYEVYHVDRAFMCLDLCVLLQRKGFRALALYTLLFFYFEEVSVCTVYLVNRPFMCLCPSDPLCPMGCHQSALYTEMSVSRSSEFGQTMLSSQEKSRSSSSTSSCSSSHSSAACPIHSETSSSNATAQ